MFLYSGVLQCFCTVLFLLCFAQFVGFLRATLCGCLHSGQSDTGVPWHSSAGTILESSYNNYLLTLLCLWKWQGREGRKAVTSGPQWGRLVSSGGSDFSAKTDGTDLQTYFCVFGKVLLPMVSDLEKTWVNSEGLPYVHTKCCTFMLQYE